MTWIEILISSLSSLIGIAGGGVGIYFWKESKDLKREDVKAKQIDNELRQADWANARYFELEKAYKERGEKISELYVKIGKLKDEIMELKGELQQTSFSKERLVWCRCDRDECKRRIPPRKYSEINEQENKI